jgi:hypothetical protein
MSAEDEAVRRARLERALPIADRGLIDHYRIAVQRESLANSDHTAYRELADVVNEVIHAESDPDSWDGDDSELELLCRFVAWLPDMVRHAVAETLRDDRPQDGERWREWGVAADLADPFDQNAAGQWVRKSDGAPVPWPVVKE